MRLGVTSYAFTWEVGVPGYVFAGGDAVPPERLTALGLLDRAASLGVSVLQLLDNVPLQDTASAGLLLLRDRRGRAGDLPRGRHTRIDPPHLAAYLRVAEALGSPLVRVVIDTADHHPGPDEVVSSFRAVLPAYDAIGVDLAIENHDRFESPVLVGILAAIGSARVGICLDTVNSLGALEPPDVVVAALGPHAMSLHVKDFQIRRVSHAMGFVVEGEPAGRGRLDVPWLLAELRSVGRDPNVLLELWTPPEPTESATIAKERRWARGVHRVPPGLPGRLSLRRRHHHEPMPATPPRDRSGARQVAGIRVAELLGRRTRIVAAQEVDRLSGGRVRVGEGQHLDRKPIVVADGLERREEGLEIDVALARRPAVAVRDLHVSHTAGRGPERLGRMGVLDVHVKRIRHEPDRGMADAIDDVDAVGQDAVDEIELVAIDRLDDEVDTELSRVVADGPDAVDESIHAGRPVGIFVEATTNATDIDATGVELDGEVDQLEQDAHGTASHGGIRAGQPGALLGIDATRRDRRDAQSVVGQQRRHDRGADVAGPTKGQLDAVVAESGDLGDGGLKVVTEDDEGRRTGVVRSDGQGESHAVTSSAADVLTAHQPGWSAAIRQTLYRRGPVSLVCMAEGASCKLDYWSTGHPVYHTGPQGGASNPSWEPVGASDGRG